ncbi:MAG TPA: MBOAT family protein [Thermoanaerobaculia bacterium]|nr:MBOAT family protein [Thermoanaerobaculia bacterium]
MVFSSHLFVFGFLPLALALYFLAPRRGRNLVLTLASYFFYGWTNPAYIPLLLASTAIDWWAGLVQGTGRWLPFAAPLRRLAADRAPTRTERAAVTVSIVSNLSILGFFKYFDFGVESWNELVRALGADGAGLETTLHVVLPLGISFYTFQSMSYSIDVYRGRATAMRSFVDFACFVSMFPQLVAGPIVRFSEVADQLLERSTTLARFARGVAFFAVGLAKKVLLANPCGKIADTVFDAASSTVLDAWYGLAAYAFQIYFDFSGYSDMAIGLGLMLGFVFPRNFDSPYHADSITDFWRRWHISLSTWLRDYLYIPLGGNRKGPGRTYVNLALTMLLGGLWHGAAWNFVLWGGLHGSLLAVERALGPHRLWGWLPRGLRTLAVFFVVLLTWIPFRSADLGATVEFAGRLFGIAAVAPTAALLPGLIAAPYLVLTFAVSALVVWTAPQSWVWTREIGALKGGLAVGLLALSLVALATQEFNPFLYFIF